MISQSRYWWSESKAVTSKILFVPPRMTKNRICKLYTSPWVRSPVAKELAEDKPSGTYLFNPTHPYKLSSLMQMILWRNENCRSQPEVSDCIKYNHILVHPPWPNDSLINIIPFLIVHIVSFFRSLSSGEGRQKENCTVVENRLQHRRNACLCSGRMPGDTHLFFF